MFKELRSKFGKPQPKKFETHVFEGENISPSFQHVKAEHEQILSGLSEPKKAKWDQCLSMADTIIRDSCNEFKVPYISYSPMLSASIDSGGIYNVTDVTKDSFVRIHLNRLRFDVENITTMLVHEILGHAILSRNGIKMSELISRFDLGISVGRFRSKMVELDRDQKIDLIQKLKKPNIDVSSFTEIQKRFWETTLQTRNEHEAKQYIISLCVESILEGDRINMKMTESKEIGSNLNEAVVDYIALTQAEKYFNKKIDYSSRYNAIRTQIKRLVGMFDENGYRGELYYILVDALQRNRPQLIMRFVYDITRVRINPKKLLNMEIDEYLEEIEERFKQSKT